MKNLKWFFKNVRANWTRIRTIWLILALVFVGLGFFHLYLSRQSITPMELDFSPPEGGPDVFAVSDAKPALVRLASDLNHHIERYNKTSRWQNILAMMGYFAGAITAFISMYYASKGVRVMRKR